MDHGKPQAVFPQVFEYGKHSPSVGDSPDIDEPVLVEDYREPRGESLWKAFIKIDTITNRLLLSGEF